MQNSSIGLSMALAQPMDAEQLAEQIHKGNSLAEAEVVARYRQALVRFLQKRGCTEDSEDYANDALLLLLTKLRSGQLKQPSKWVGYVYGVAGNLWSAHQRKLARRKTETNSELIDTTFTEDPAFPQEVFRVEVIKQLLDSIGRLSTDRDKSILIRFYLLEQDKKEICDDMELTPTQFDRIVHRARKRLATATDIQTSILRDRWLRD